MPSAIKKDHELRSKGLVSILLERQGHGDAEVAAFLLKTFPDNDCLSAVGGAVPTPDFSGIPHGVLIGVDGTLLWDGSPLGQAQQLDALIQQEVAKVQKGWGDSGEARKARAALYGKGQLAAAQEIVTAMADGDEKTALQGEIDRRFAVLKKRVGALQEAGRMVEAQDAAKDLLRAVGTQANWLGEVQPLVAAFETPAARAELSADKKLERVVKQLREKNREGAAKALQSVVKSAGDGSKVGARATKLLQLLEMPVR